MSPSPDLSDVQDRRTKIKTELAEIRQREKALVSEDQELEVAERVLLRLAGYPETPPSVIFSKDNALEAWISADGWKTPARPFDADRATIKDAIEWLLEGSVDPWATSAQIQAALSATLTRPVPMSTVSPTLTVMKDDEIIVRDGLKVALTSRVRPKNETPPIKRRSIP
jgi:hypothetical protein